MTDRQRRFAEHYAACGNAAEAARLAGYSERTARGQGQRLLTNADVLGYVRQLQDVAASARIATMAQVRAFWSDVLNDPEARTADRLRAGELLAKSAGAFVHTRPGEDDLAFGDDYPDDVIIYLPDNGRDQQKGVI